MNKPLGHSGEFKKLLRFAGIYGWPRAINKAIARTRPPWLRPLVFIRRKPAISVIGCGQFAFSCVCYYLQKQIGTAFLSAFDTDWQQAQSLCRYYGFREVTTTPDALLNNPKLEVLYVVSNHASHTDYAVEGLTRNKIVYVEKPVSVTRHQLVRLCRAVRQSSGQVFAGYNRPYSKAIQLLRKRVDSSPVAAGFSISCVINGHRIPSEHWYRNPEEGTRICGNLGHWIDLTIHLFSWRSLPGWIDIQIAYANPNEPDDDLTVTFTTDRYDIVSILLTSRSEPFEGISEFINIQYNHIIAHIDDFRRLTIWQGSIKKVWRFSTKDVGHQRAVMQPFLEKNRNWSEVELSTLLMLFIRDMVLKRQTGLRFNTHQELTRFEADLKSVSLLYPPFTHEKNS
ncbi:Gfo/Idh/MocA family oxidoreductase [Spirosoma aureum]|uniref:Gfo/Idh/MocA family oxidoreductase n=1 Tax=Spirosoma aureum TaxID=2692134 RepID=A0A6G9AV58_9BACT|nr:Gfo/Idh/MocA family oxidoreductase [Spirosoma aureum]QIP16234.1 Gfo/Idh/MocA family oxidoreductase [Spirosoma aureum]